MQKEILEERLKELEWTPYKLAQEVTRLKSIEKGENKNVTSYVSSVRQALMNPERSTLRTLETIIKALDGELVIRWKEKKEIVTGSREVIIE